MSESGKNIKKYSAEDIRLYLEGRLSPDEMHAIEKAAMEDPFLTDAIEGMEIQLQQSGPGTFEQATEELRKRLNERVKRERKTILFANRNVLWKVAAILIIIISGIAVTLNIVERNPKQGAELAKRENFKDSIHRNDEVNVAPLQKDTPYGTTTTQQKAAGVSRVSKEENNNQKVEIITHKEDEPDPASATVKIPDRETSPGIPDSITPSVAARASEVQPTKSPERQLQGKAAGVDIKSSENTKANHFVQGRVIDEQGNPVPAAVIQVKNKKAATVTDKDGQFSLQSSTLDSSINVLVNSVGYEPASVTLRINDSSANLVSLQPSNAALSEVVVVGYGVSKKKRREMVSKPSSEQRIRERITPVGGWDAFDDYINKNKNISTADSLVKGNEVISFVINDKGRPSEIKIEKSLSPAHDSKSIRLLNEGPAWKVIKGKKRKVSLKIIF